MKFQGLFLKIFLWFWLTMLLVASAAGLAMWLTRPDMSEFKHFQKSRSTIRYMSLVDIYEEEGAEKARSTIKKLPFPDADKVLIIKEDLTDIFNRKCDKAIVDSAKEAFKSNKGLNSTTDGHKFSVRPVLSITGKRFVIVSFRGDKGRPHFPMDFLFGGSISTIVLRAILLLVTTFLLCFGLASYITNPIITLQKAAAKIAMGKFDHRIEPAVAGRNDELIDLARDFDIMAERIEELLSNQQKLLGDISHELRTPLTRQNVALELAREASPEELPEHLDRIERESGRLLELINSIVTLVRLSGSDDHFSADTLNMSDLVSSVVSDSEIESKDRDCTIEVEVENNLEVHGSRELLRRAVENVVRNALRHSKEKGSIHVSCKSHDGLINITVDDDGRGVPEDELEKLFEPFYRCEDARERSKGGVGLGLAIVKRSMDYHKGSVKASNITNSGLRISLNIPTKKNRDN